MAVTTIGKYLIERIAQLGVKTIIGVPGDMNLELLDYIDEVEGMSWAGTANELGAAYACDGYCRVKQAPGVLVTTMGVGELSAINGIAGAYTEQVKVIHLVGTTSTAAQKNRAMIHHSLGPDPDHKIYAQISSHVRAAHCWLDDASTAASEVDKVLRECYLKSLPVYIFVPTDCVHKPIPAAHLARPLSLGWSSDPLVEDQAVTAVTAALQNAKRPALLVDALVHRFAASDSLRRLLDLLKFPTFSTSMGKSIADEDLAYYHGTYNGKVCPPWMHSYIEKESDLVLEFGPLLADSNTGGHSREIAADKLISVHPDRVVCFGVTYTNVNITQFLPKLRDRIASTKVETPKSLAAPALEVRTPTKDITQDYIWHRLAAFCRPGDVLIAESGTAQFGFPDVRLPPKVEYITQVYFGSIGYSVGACLGAAIAAKEKKLDARVILVVGDGSLQLTAQEIGTMIRLGLDNIKVIVINNKGYTIERAIHGPEKGYNGISAWNHQLMLSFYGHASGQDCSWQSRTVSDLEAVLTDPKFADSKPMQMLEIHMGVMDIPWRLRDQIKLVESRMKAAKG